MNEDLCESDCWCDFCGDLINDNIYSPLKTRYYLKGLPICSNCSEEFNNKQNSLVDSLVKEYVDKANKLHNQGDMIAEGEMGKNKSIKFAIRRESIFADDIPDSLRKDLL